MGIATNPGSVLVHHMEMHHGFINVSTIMHVTTISLLTISTLSVSKEAMEWEPIHSNPKLSVVVIILDMCIIILV